MFIKWCDAADVTSAFDGWKGLADDDDDVEVSITLVDGVLDWGVAMDWDGLGAEEEGDDDDVDDDDGIAVDGESALLGDSFDDECDDIIVLDDDELDWGLGAEEGDDDGLVDEGVSVGVGVGVGNGGQDWPGGTI